jgi:hypothetical protein
VAVVREDEWRDAGARLRLLRERGVTVRDQPRTHLRALNALNLKNADNAANGRNKDSCDQPPLA